MESTVTTSVISAVLLVAIPVTLIGNALVIMVILKLRRALRVSTHYILLNIAVCDLLTGLLSQPIMLLNLTAWDEEFHRSHDWFCNVTSCMQAALAYVSFFTVAGIALDRCLVVLLKHRYKLIVTKIRMLTAILVMWVVALLMVFPVPKLYCPSYQFAYRSERQMCIASDITDKSPHYVLARDNRTIKAAIDNTGYGFIPQGGSKGSCKKIVAFVESIALIATPIAVVILTSVVLIVSLLNRMCSQSRVVRRSVHTVVVMMIGFSCCVLPYCATVGIDPKELGGEAMLVLVLLMLLHSSINPVIYLVRSEKFRKQAFVIGSGMVKDIDQRQRTIRYSIKRIYD